jgi:hypothetical protein
MNIQELFYLKLLERIPNKKPYHTIIYYQLINENKYLTFSELLDRNIPAKITEQVINDLLAFQLIKKEGCLIKIQSPESLVLNH